MGDTVPSNQTIYFGYGSNLWLHQMAIRCPDAMYLGVGKLKGFKWIINGRGYANVVEVDDKQTSQKEKEEDVVYGLVYTLSPSDEERLDKNEGVPVAYTKEYLETEIWSAGEPSKPESEHEKVDTWGPASEKRDVLVYIDRKRVEESTPREEYVFRMNRGVEDALKVGVPKKWVEKVVRRFIKEEDGEGEGKEVEELARGQAQRFRDESGVF